MVYTRRAMAPRRATDPAAIRAAEATAGLVATGAEAAVADAVAAELATADEAATLGVAGAAVALAAGTLIAK